MVHVQASILAALALVAPALAQTAPDLGRACNFVLLATSAVTTGAASLLYGNVGISPTTLAAMSIGGGMRSVVNQTYFIANPRVEGLIHGPGNLTDGAVADVRAAYTDARTREPTGAVNVRDPILDGQNFTAGVYQWTTVVNLSAGQNVTLIGSATDVFIFQMVALATGAASQILLIGGISPSNIFWVPTSTLGLGAASQFYGIALAGSALNVGAGALWNGAAYALSAASIGTAVILSNPSGGCGTGPETAPAAFLTEKAKRAQVTLLPRESEMCEASADKVICGGRKQTRAQVMLA
ncbi:hypothetical protein RQP46_003205 [Phenoliferia psychrophenolica]